MSDTQATDLFTASINRKLNVSVASFNQKDDLADFILGLTGFDISQIDFDNSTIDNSVVFNLSPSID
jgi:hypothetical protein